ncbi:PAS domain S-box protein [Halalkalirubrum salinum]|uniref:PAS domain S-box protein n=1 Tax=Halalkalirubrum salinum TaxID=2563889 RepID=UPI0014854F4D|nr:PAS domain S-box protein [Halalkalirubrum salinum]
MNGDLSYLIEDEIRASQIKTLVVDDDRDLADLTATFLEREQGAFETTVETTVAAALDRIEEIDFDAIVSDYDMGRLNGLDFLERVRTEYPDIPFILFTGKGSEEIASEAISKGVTDYLQKETGASQYSVLANRLLNAVEKHRATETVKRSERRFSRLVENSTDVISIVGESGAFEYVSPSAERILGYPPSELLGEWVFDYAHPDDRQEAMEKFFAAVENPEIQPTVEFRFNDPDGEWPVLQSRGRNMLTDECIQGFVINSRDISDLKEQEQALRQRNEQLEDMKRAISHDIKSPLSVASNSLVLYDETGDDELLQKVDRSISRIEGLIDQTIALVEQGTDVTDSDRISLTDVCTAAWDMVNTNGAELHIDNSREFTADPDRLQRVFENLFRNAVEHSGSDVTVSVGTTNEGIYVADDGPGIPEEDREVIFETGYTTAVDNTGFGLPIVKQVLLAHGWEIDVGESDAGGARFDIAGVEFVSSVYK